MDGVQRFFSRVLPEVRNGDGQAGVMEDGGALGLGALREIVDIHHQDGDDAHKRLREDLNGLGGKVGYLERELHVHEKQLIELTEWRKQPTEVTSLRFTPAMVIAMITLCASIVGGQKWSTWGLSDQMSTQATDTKVISAKMDAIKQHNDDMTTLQNERYSHLADELTRTSAQTVSIDAKINNLMNKTTK